MTTVNAAPVLSGPGSLRSAETTLLGLRNLPTEAIRYAALELAPKVADLRRLYTEARGNELDRSRDAVATNAVVTFEDGAAFARLTVGSRHFQDKSGPVAEPVEITVRFADENLTRLQDTAALHARDTSQPQPVGRVALPELPATWAHRSLAAVGSGAAVAGTAYVLGGVALAASSPLLVPLIVGAGLAGAVYGARKPQHGMGLFAAAGFAGAVAALVSPYLAPAGAVLGWLAGRSFSREV